MSATSILEQLKGHHILIVGDVMIDRYLSGEVSRISPEAPVPVLFQKKVENRLGGAANVALNLRALSSEAYLCSVVGKDADGQVFREILPQRGLSAEGIIESSNRRTTVKTRVLAGTQQMIRVDQEDLHLLSQEEEDELFDRIEHLIESKPIRGLIFQDYNKGVLSPSLIQRVTQLTNAKGIPTAVDPKKDHFFAYQNVDLFKPNLKEIRDSAPFDIEVNDADLQKSAQFLQEQLKNKITMITLSEKGIYLNTGGSGKIYPTIPRTIADVSGAGDTVIGIAALGLAAGLNLSTIAIICNLAGGQVCEFPGVVPVKPELLEKELEHWLEKEE
jgi:rfaE bifunctional protein kinase chain/domain